ncbi:MAG: ATP-binding cassette domain-containing protein [Rickettsiales bacterium]|nr:ATP-binding cassette domain-containing protein [Rickettsiales bacterium]
MPSIYSPGDNYKAPSFSKLLQLVLIPERSFYVLAIVYGLAISLLTLAVPISVQTLVSTVANTALLNPVVILSVMLLTLLGFSGALNALQYYVMELFERRFYARITGDIALRNIYAQYSHFESINRAELINRYFEIMVVQKNVPLLVTGAFSLGLQTVVGISIVSFYHPVLLMFNVLLLLAIIGIWKIWGARAMHQALDVSAAKYTAARWLEELARANHFFKSEKHILFALDRTDELTGNYINARKKLFRSTISQNISFLLLYALASSMLLGIGGWLVISNQLTLGQLVAAELILSAILFGLSKFASQLSLFYELYASLEKISHFYKIPLEDTNGRYTLDAHTSTDITIDKVEHRFRSRHFILDFMLPAGSKIMAVTSSNTLEKLIIDLLQGHREPTQGRILVGQHDLLDYNLHVLRERILVLDNAMMIEGTIENYLHFGCPKASRADIHHVLRAVDLEETIGHLKDGLETEITPSGYPLSYVEVLRLKLAVALLSKPNVLVITEIYDILNHSQRRHIFEYIHGLPEMSLLYFSNRQDVHHFDQYLLMNHNSQTYFSSLEALRQAEILGGT